jgi:hypothetical protein
MKSAARIIADEKTCGGRRRACYKSDVRKGDLVQELGDCNLQF